MPVATQTSTTATTAPRTDAGVLKLRGSHTQPQTTAFEELDKNGYCVVPSVISSEKADGYVQKVYEWLEGFGKGFKRDDRSTWKPENLPGFFRAGLFNRQGAGHEQFAWDIRSEQAVIDVFARIWGTDQLLVSFDGVNASLPFDKAAAVDRSPWPHVDQSPNRRHKHCVQGIMNLYENGPLDGGLMVLEGSYPLYNEFFEAHEHEAPEGGWKWIDSYHHTESQLQWFYDRGCTWKKVEAGPGDVILWDSRCIHYGAAAEGDKPRIATYICYKPARDSPPEQNALRKECIRQWDMTSHDPILFRPTGSRIFEAEGRIPKGEDRLHPSTSPILSLRAQQLAGITSY